VLFGLLKCLLDSHKRVQELACTAFIEVGDSAKHRLKPYIYTILTHTKKAFELYQRKNRLMLYDALRTLAGAVGSDLNKSEYISLLMPPLISKWNKLADNDTNLFPLLEVKKKC
jgi:transportin-1